MENRVMKLEFGKSLSISVGNSIRSSVNDLSLKLMKNSLLTSTLYLVGDSVVLLDSARSIRESINTSFRIEL
jgi:hypothetical protein